MWRWIRRWRDWVVNEILVPHRMTSQSQALYFSSEKAGLVLSAQPIPWGAEAVVVEALLRLPRTARRKADFTFRIPEHAPIPAESLRRDEATDRYRLFFRLPVPEKSVTGELFWRHHRLGAIELPLQTSDAFLTDLQVHLPTVFVQLGTRSVGAQSFVGTQCKAITAMAMLRSTAGLAPLLDLPLFVRITSDKTGTSEDYPVALVPSQLTGKEVMASVVLPRSVGKTGERTYHWLCRDRELATQRIRVLSSSAFYRSLRLCGTRFVVEPKRGKLQICPLLPPLNEIHRVGPCFFVSSSELGAAGLAHFRITLHVPGTVSPPTVLEQTVLVTDGPTVVAPGLVDASELVQASAFELRREQRLLGTLPLSPVPSAVINAEGAFKPPPEFIWSNTAEDELLDRLSKLMDVERKNPTNGKG